jgi:acetylornithine deacetylase/succinyl-diaminopimelate desuccinylase-like protein
MASRRFDPRLNGAILHPMTTAASIDQYIDTHFNEFVDELKVLCAQPSISAQGLGIRECADLVAGMLRQRGFTAEVVATGGHPVVYGEAPGRGDKTLLFYNHYDVQPPEPLELWDSPPTVRDGVMYARGVSDDKGHIVCRLAALDAVKSALGDYPCRVKFVIEGEEETSSMHLHEFVENNLERLKADACIWEFGGVDHRGNPSEYLGLRGICYVELTVETGTLDAHSGLGGTIFPNAAWRLIWALASLKGPDERIRIRGFYDDAKPPTPRDLELLEALPDNSEDMLRTYGLKGFLHDMHGGVDLRRQEVFVPSCTICGLTTGYQGKGSKTVLPARASAKVDFRLVPDQNPEDILAKLRKHLDAEGFDDVKIDYLGGERPARTDPDDPFVKLVVDTAREVYDKEMIVHPMNGGSGPSYPFVHDLNLPVATAGVGYPGSRAHAPNENLRLDNFKDGIRHTARILERFGNS